MERHLLRSITFHPHWWGYQHDLPATEKPKDRRPPEHDALEIFRTAHQDRDPFGLLSAYQDPASLAATTNRPPQPPCRWIQGLKTSWQTRRLHHFYHAQNATIERLLQDVAEHQASARASATSDALHFKLAVYGSLAANIVLSGVQLFAAVQSGSLSLIATMADAVFDPLSNAILIAANRATRSVDRRRFPSGRARLETIGNIVFCFLMLAVSVVLIAFSVRDLADGMTTRTFQPSAVIAAASSFATKLCLFAYCYGLKDRYSQVRIVWQDHRNDLFINGFGILTSVGGAKLAWWIDPAGAIVLSMCIAGLWCRTAAAEFLLVVGVAASPETQQLVTYIALTHEAHDVTGIDTVRVYYSGPRLIVEVDLVMDKMTRLQSAHDVSEHLQEKLEALPSVERAYVHVDYETSHRPEHSFIKNLQPVAEN